MHASCYQLFLQHYTQDNPLNGVWIATEWRRPWKHDLNPQHGFELEDISIVSLALLHPTLVQDIRSMSPDSEVWAYLAIKDLAEGISSAAGQDDSQSCMLDRVESWTRGEGAPVISDSTAGDWGIRVTKDRRGIRKTERLVGLPSYALIPPDQARTSGVDFRIGVARIKLSGNGKSVMWDTPNPPRSGDEPQETLPAPRFPVISLSPYELAYGGNAITVDISLKGTVRVDIFKDSSTGCFRGFLLEYENGSQRTAGQCRVGVDPVTVCHKPVSFCYRKVQGGDFDVHKYYELECCPETGDPHYDHASPDGAWTCSDFGVSQEFITIEDLIQQCPPGNLSEEGDYYDYEAFADNFDGEPLYWPEPGVEEEEDERHICL
ncbi:hypothetical protein FOC4_g10014266 [Fusarium odoratissimum]|uniref:Uncharacterized protein n=1 Tax=Fusarium oxysporum f. sp. cubense (strain race 4) TaxID=2502994 RepID=N1RAS6_FUSC4|nr:hypothetical protein FOC4_g10014266 [Fusarium odoratissimum]